MEYDNCAEEMLILTGKNDELSKQQICKSLGYLPEVEDNEEMAKFDVIYCIRNDALEFLRKKPKKTKDAKNPDFIEFHNKIESFRDSLQKSCLLMQDPIVKDFLLHQASKDPEISSNVIVEKYSDTYDKIRSLGIEMEIFLKSNRAAGKPSLRALYAYVYELAYLYESISGKKLSVLRYKDDQGEYIAVSPGHEFVNKAIQFMNEEAKSNNFASLYTDKNIYNACEEAQKRLKAFK